MGERWTRRELCRALAVNGLTGSRLVLAAAFPFVPTEWRLAVALLAGFTDLIDGALGRALGVTSTFGQILDPIADKCFVLSVLMTLLLDRAIPPWELGLVAFRDFAVLFGCFVVLARDGWERLTRLPPTWLGKLTTAGQFAYLAWVLAIPGTPAPRGLVLPVIGVSIIAGLDYLARQMR